MSDGDIAVRDTTTRDVAILFGLALLLFTLTMTLPDYVDPLNRFFSERFPLRVTDLVGLIAVGVAVAFARSDRVSGGRNRGMDLSTIWAMLAMLVAFGCFVALRLWGTPENIPEMALTHVLMGGSFVSAIVRALMNRR